MRKNKCVVACVENKMGSYLHRLIILHFTFQFRGPEIIELKNFKPASADDIASVHAKAYIDGLEQVVLP